MFPPLSVFPCGRERLLLHGSIFFLKESRRYLIYQYKSREGRLLADCEQPMLPFFSLPSDLAGSATQHSQAATGILKTTSTGEGLVPLARSTVFVGVVEPTRAIQL